MKRNLLLVVLAAALLGAANPAWGDFYIIPVPASMGMQITALPYTITKPGLYYLKGSLTSSSDGIIINADDVTIDLMGFSITGPGQFSGNNDGIRFTNRKNLEIRNGAISKFGRYGINGVGDNNKIVKISVSNNNSGGINIGGQGIIIKHCIANNNANYGINGRAALIAENVAYWNQSGFWANSCTVIGNVAYNNSQYGFNVSSCLVDQNNAYANNTNYIYSSDPNLICTWGVNHGK